MDRLDARAPDLVACHRSLVEGRPVALRREIRRRSGPRSANGIVGQLDALSGALLEVVGGLPDHAFALPGGEEDWTVAEAIGHDVAARQGLALAAALAASGRWPADAPTVVPGVPGPTDAHRGDLEKKIALSQKMIARAARSIAGHELVECPLDHPLVGRLRCGEWLLFAGVHDLMHLEQLHELAARLASEGLAASPAEAGGPR